MPTYEYECSACKHGFEVEQRITEPFVRDCPACKKPALTRLVGTGNFILKGSGWYADLYSGSGGGKNTESDTSAKSTQASSETSSATSSASAAPTSSASSSSTD